MLNKRELLAAYNRGELETAARECMRYGSIMEDAQWEEAEGHYSGCNRVQSVSHCGITWTITKHNGEVIELAHNGKA